jgi:SAM-dependent methyltransferase
MKIEYLNGAQIDYQFVAGCIPKVMNALYNEDVSSVIPLHEIRDAFRVKQMQSKAWLIDTIKNSDLSQDSNILVIGSWLGFTSLCLAELGFKNITETDPDQRLELFAKHLNRFNKNFIHESKDVNDLDMSKFDVIINTSCEHILDNTWFCKIQPNTKVFLHSNNLLGYDHVNTCESVEDMIKKYPMNLDYAGVLNLKSYKRFMLVGSI